MTQIAKDPIQPDDVTKAINGVMGRRMAPAMSLCESLLNAEPNNLAFKQYVESL